MVRSIDTFYRPIQNHLRNQKDAYKPLQAGLTLCHWNMRHHSFVVSLNCMAQFSLTFCFLVI